MSNYTVKQLASLSGVSIRALHHYDEIGLLKPAFTGENNYRYYGRAELLRLQDILFHRELGLPLKDIGDLLSTNGHDRVTILIGHRKLLAQQMKRSRQLLRTIDRTIADLNGEDVMNNKELYKGFDPKKQAEHEAWLIDNNGPKMREAIDTSKAHVSKLGKDGMQDALAEGEAAEAALAEYFLSGEAPDAEAASPALERHRAWVAGMWGRECSPAAYGGLADMYLAHPDFRTRYEAHGAGFTEWLTSAMKAHAARLA